MNKENIEKLLLSEVQEDRLLGMEYLTRRTKKEILEIIPDRDNVGWYRMLNQNHIEGALASGKVWRCKQGYIAYNGLTWYLTDKKELSQYGYKLEENE